MSVKLFKERLPQQNTKKDEKFYFEKLCRTIAGQQLSGKAAETIYGRFVTLLGRKAISPKNILELKDQDIRDVGFSWGKVSYIKDLAKHVQEKRLHLQKLEYLSDEEIEKELVAVKGLGPWSAEMFMMFTIRRDNIFSHGDLGLKNGIEKVYKIKNPTKKQREKIVTKWEPYKTYGSLALWNSLDNA